MPGAAWRRRRCLWRCGFGEPARWGPRRLFWRPAGLIELGVPAVNRGCALGQEGAVGAGEQERCERRGGSGLAGADGLVAPGGGQMQAGGPTQDDWQAAASTAQKVHPGPLALNIPLNPGGQTLPTTVALAPAARSTKTRANQPIDARTPAALIPPLPNQICRCFLPETRSPGKDHGNPRPSGLSPSSQAHSPSSLIREIPEGNS